MSKYRFDENWKIVITLSNEDIVSTITNFLYLDRFYVVFD